MNPENIDGEERNCPEGINKRIISTDIGFSILDATVIHEILERIVAGESVDSFGDEAARLLGNLSYQLVNKINEDQ